MYMAHQFSAAFVLNSISSFETDYDLIRLAHAYFLFIPMMNLQIDLKVHHQMQVIALPLAAFPPSVLQILALVPLVLAQERLQQLQQSPVK